MPKQRITQQMVLDAAFALLREGGPEQVLVKNIAQKLGCSVQPIYTYCSNMEGLHRQLEQKAAEFFAAYLASHVDRADLFRSTGYAYLQLAKEEPAIFRLVVLRKRENVSSLSALYAAEASPHVAPAIAAALHIPVQTAQSLHLAMLIFNVGVGTILASCSPGIPIQEMSAQLETAHRAFLQYFTQQEDE